MSNKIKLQKITQEPIVRFNGELIFLPADLQKKIDKYWNELLDSGRKYYRGEVFTVKYFQNNKDKIEIILQKTDFAHYLYNRQIDNNLGEFNVQIVYANTLVWSADDKIIFGHMGKHTAEAGRYQFSGGGLDNNDLKNEIFNMKYSAARELLEEFGIDVNDKSRVKNFSVEWLKTGGNDTIAVIHKIKLIETAGEFLNNYKKFTKDLRNNGETPEFSKVVILSLCQRDVEKFIDENKNKIPEYLPMILREIVKEK